MCTQYWNLVAEVACPKCGQVRERELQTHWMGELGSCLNHYRLGEPVEELAGITAATIGEANEPFIAHCRDCGTDRDHNGQTWRQPFYFDCGGRVENGAVIEVWPLDQLPDVSVY